MPTTLRASAGPADFGALLTNQAIHNTDEFAEQRSPAARWLADGSAYTVLEPAAAAGSGGLDIVRYTAAGGERVILVPAAGLVPAGAATLQPLAIADYRWSDDGGKLLLFTNTAKVWRRHTRGEYYVVDLASGKLQQIGGPGLEPSSLMYAKFCPGAGEQVGYLYQVWHTVRALRYATRPPSLLCGCAASH